MKSKGEKLGTGLRGTLIWIEEGSWNGSCLVRLHMTDADQSDTLEELQEVSGTSV